MQIRRSGQLNRTDFANHSNRHGGFTMVELIVVICILLILAGSVTTGVVKWIAYSDFKEQNDYAKTLYLAAQNQLTEYSASGQLDAKLLLDDPTGDGIYDQPVQFDEWNLIGSNNETITLDRLWPARQGKSETEKKRYTGTVCYIMGTADDYAQYRQDAAGLDPLKRAMYDMLTPYLYDTSILDATVCLEFTPEDGQVYSVLYSNNKENKDFVFTYNATGNLRGKDVSISSREVDYREDRMVGYWGVDTLSRATGATADKPVFVDVKLNNENTLNLSFRFSKVEEAINHLTYEIEVLDSASKKKRMVLLVDGTKLNAAYSAAQVSADCEVIRYDADEKKIGSQTYPVLLMQETDNTVRIVLDAADLSATSAYYQASADELEPMALGGGSGSDAYREFAKAYSFSRFGLDLENIYCTVKGYGDIYKTTAKKQSNASHVYFAAGTSETESGKVTDTYSLSNARHLYNIRYYEDSTATPLRSGKDDHTVLYQLTRNIDWRQFIEDGGLYDTQKLLGGDTDPRTAVVNSATAFPAIQKLRENAVFTSRGSRLYTVSGLTLSEEDNTKLKVYDSYTGGRMESKSGGEVGIFRINYGTIRGVMLDQIRASGTNCVGAFCGRNEGTLDNLRINNSAQTNPALCSQILGEENVGGFAGMSEAEKNVGYTNLGNYARVYGIKNVGGIAGSIQVSADAESPVVIDGCINYGAIEANTDSAKMQGGSGINPTLAQKIGGIVGSLENNTEKEENLTIQNCISVPEYTNAELTEIFENNENLEKKLNGVYVGGIAGYSAHSTITNCRTENIGGGSAYIFGYQYVGGIVGFADFHTGASELYGGAGGGLNGANVIGYSYVGGITGANSEPGRAGENGVLLPAETENKELNVSNWTNRGVIAAAGSYAGGITGYNAGTLEECGSEVSSDADARIITGVPLLQQADYVGGIAGTNRGWIQSDRSDSQSLDVVSYLTGRNYVGGIAGQNEKDAVISGYRLNGGFVRGTGAFVGGFIGMNASTALFSDTSIEKSELFEANPNEISGKYAVGGIIGGNLVPVDDDTVSLYARFNTNNFLGEITAEGMAGGFIGYNGLYKKTADVKADAEKICAYSAEDSAEDNSSYLKLYEDKLYEELEKQGKVKKNLTTTARLIIDGTGNAGSGPMRFGSLTVKLYGGGVVGYNQRDTYLTIKNVANQTQVKALDYVKGKLETDASNGQYAYVGGIAGKVTEHMVIDNCRNQGEGAVTSGGTYLGGICEVNEGTVQNCTVPNISGENSVGGIVGLNKKTGTVEKCTFPAESVVSGRSYVGGIAAENYGTIKEIQLQGGTLRSTESFAGGITGGNLESGTIILMASEPSEPARLTIISDGEYVGGIVGENGATVKLDSTDPEARFTFSGSVSGSRYVGGMLGSNGEAGGANKGDGQPISQLRNEATVTALKGNAGGIAGKAVKDISSCENTGTISATKSGDAGGIVAENGNLIQDCVNTGLVNSANGECGGIASVNSGRIVNCTVKGETEPLVLSGLSNAGGMVGMNQGQIQGGTVENLKISNTEQSGASYVGGAAGMNSSPATVSDTQVRNCEISVYTSGSYAGGIAGINGFTIAGATVTGNTKISLAGNHATYANLGGAAGFNGASIANCDITAEITGDMGTETTGYGGIAGVNQAIIQNCKFSGTVRANGSGDNIVSIGGTTGINYARIKNCFVGTGQDTVITSGYQNENTAMGYVGGMVGQNREGAIIEKCDNYGQSKYQVEVTNYSGHTGGIVGYQMANAVVNTLSTGEKWKIESKFYIFGSGTGGIIGYSNSGTNIIDVKNYAEVNASYRAAELDNVVAGGLIGRLENNSRNNMQIQGFENHGKISGVVAGGAIGRWKYKGATFEKCINYGDIVSKGTGCKAAGGLVGNFMNNNESGDTIVFSSCENHGKITCDNSNSAGGISGSTSSDSAVTVIYTDCINTGIINAKDGKGGGIAGATDKQTAFFYRCRNYGFSENFETKENKDKTTTKVYHFRGIVGKKASATAPQTLQYCFSFGSADGVAEKSDYCKVTECYYYSKESTSNAAGTKITVESKKIKFTANLDGNKSEQSWTFSEDIRAYNGNDRREKAYKLIEPMLLKLYTESLKSTSSTPKELKISNTDDWITVTWKHNNERYFGDQLMLRILNEDGSVYQDFGKVKDFEKPKAVPYGVQKYTIPMNAGWKGKKFEVAVRSILYNYSRSDYGDAWLKENGPNNGANEDAREGNASVWANIISGKLLTGLPAPEVHLELAPDAQNQYTFIAVLENQKAYSGDKATTVRITGKDIFAIDIPTSEGRSEPFTFTNAESKSKTFTAIALANGKYAASSIVSNDAAAYDGTNLQNTQYVKTTFDDFYGDRFGSLYNQIRLDKESSVTDIYMNTEVVVDDYAVTDAQGSTVAKIPMTVARGNVHVSAYGGEMTSILNQLPEDFLDYGNVTARVYPWRGQAEVFWYGHPVAEKIKRDDLIGYIQNRSLLDTQRNNTAVFILNGKETEVSSGYSISLNPDGTYDVIYSSILDYKDTYKKQIKEKTYKKKDGQITGTDFNAAVQPRPVLDPTLEISEDGMHYTFRWDSENADPNAVYDIQLIGRSEQYNYVTGETEVGEVPLETLTVDSNSHTFVDQNNNWNYNAYILTVTRVGEVDKNGKTTAFSAKATKDYAVRLRFSQLPMPTISLHRDANGEVNKDTLLYDITWSMGTIAERKTQEIGAYEVKIAYTVNGEEHADILQFEAPVPLPDKENATQSAVLDLNAYAPGQTLRISVRSLAKEDAVTRRDGVEGVAREITLPSRQSVPNVAKLSAEPEYAADKFVTQAEWEKGIRLAVQDAEIQQTGKYEIAISVYNEKAEPDRQTVSEGDAPDLTTGGYWNSDALATLLSKASRTTMEGDLASATYQLVTGLKTDYAGKWLKIALRNISESNISSNWTDEDADELTENYAWIRLPRLQIESPELSDSDINLYYDPDSGEWSLTDSGASGLILVNQTALDLTLADRASAYRIEITPENSGTETQNPDGTEKKATDLLYLEAVAGETDLYHVFYLSAEEAEGDGSAENEETQSGGTQPEAGKEPQTDENEAGESEETPICSRNEKAVFIGEMNLQEEGSLVLPPVKELIQNYELIDVNAVMLLHWKKAETGKQREIQLIMPEAKSITLADGTEYQSNQNRFSGSVTVYALVSEEDRHRYADSLSSGWIASYNQ